MLLEGAAQTARSRPWTSWHSTPPRMLPAPAPVVVHPVALPTSDHRPESVKPGFVLLMGKSLHSLYVIAGKSNNVLPHLLILYIM